MSARNLLAYDLLECINTGDLETGREGNSFYLQISDVDHIFEAPVEARVTVTHDLSTHDVTVSADGQEKLLVTCMDVEDAINVSDLLARCLFAPIE